MARHRIPATPAIRYLREAAVQFSTHPYKYEDAGGAANSASELGVPLHTVIKTLVLADDHLWLRVVFQKCESAELYGGGIQIAFFRQFACQTVAG